MTWRRARRSALVGFMLVPTLVVGASASAEPVCREVLITMSDGSRLYGHVKLPSAKGAFPTVWTMTPYGPPACSGEHSAAPAVRKTLERFAIVTVHLRGTGASEGALDGYAARDRKDWLEVADWIVRQPWSDDRILAMGASATAYSITYSLRHPNVLAGVQQTSCVDGYRGCLRPGGGMVGGTLILTAGVLQGFASNVQTRQRLGLDIVDPARVQSSVTALTDQWARDTYDDFWHERSTLPFLARNTKPVMYTTDLYDYVPWSMYDAYELTPHARLSTGRGHNSFVMSQQGKLPELVGDPIDRFIRHYVLGERNRAERDPKVRLMTNVGSVRGYQAGRVLVRWENDWPLPSTRWTHLYLSGAASGSAASLNDGSLGLDTASGQTIAPAISVAGPKSELRALLTASTTGLEPPLTMLTGEPGHAFAAVGDLRAEEARSLTFSTPVLRRNVEVTGPLTFRLFATSTTPNLEWAVRVTDVWPDGRSEWITDGQLRASLRRVDVERSTRNDAGEIVRPWHTYEQHELVPPGEVVEYLIQVTPTSNVFLKSHRIRLDVVPIASQSFDGARTAGVGVVIVHHSREYPSSVLLPLIPARCHRGTPGVAGLVRPSQCARSMRSAF